MDIHEFTSASSARGVAVIEEITEGGGSSTCSYAEAQLLEEGYDFRSQSTSIEVTGRVERLKEYSFLA